MFSIKIGVKHQVRNSEIYRGKLSRKQDKGLKSNTNFHICQIVKCKR